MIDKQKIESLFKDLDTYLKEVKQLSLLSVEEYLNNARNIYSGRYLLQISIETCINIGNHIISRNHWEFLKNMLIPLEFCRATISYPNLFLKN